MGETIMYWNAEWYGKNAGLDFKMEQKIGTVSLGLNKFTHHEWCKHSDRSIFMFSLAVVDRYIFIFYMDYFNNISWS